MDKDDIIHALGGALKLASDHLDYCGYGDSWEREIAKDSGLEDDINRAIGIYEEYCS